MVVLRLNQHRSWAREGRIGKQAPDDGHGPILVSLVPYSGGGGEENPVTGFQVRACRGEGERSVQE